ncbi:uncharacterized protein BXIN_0856 [Babesia sp. Xinjiang]|uniref:uncharacterized protein n=1 Tax=Babesia sp. Xinjiang TaxID=462227 RepID=UPI000A2317F8|nr:uncharacterized protein BXIN_0856 [Babesia sp. Xinjiang]ORM41274.1 hypothetical protein BXIN_0856 [Babesia sp. Xinjiang]
MIATRPSTKKVRARSLIKRSLMPLQQFKSTSTTGYLGHYGDFTYDERRSDSCKRYSSDKVSCFSSSCITLQVVSPLCRASTFNKVHHTYVNTLKYVLRYNTFRKWAKSYHGNVRNSLGEEIANVWYTKQRYGMALKALARAVRNRRIQQAKCKADTFALKVILSRWRAIAKHGAAKRSDNATALIFYQTSLAARALLAFKSSLQRRKNCKRYLYRLVDVIEKCIRDKGITPLRQYVTQSRRLDDCAAKIAHSCDINAKNVAFGALHFIYRCHVASCQLESLCFSFVLRNGWERTISRYRNAVEAVLCYKRAIITAAGRLTKCIHNCHKRASFAALLDNSSRFAEELMKQHYVEDFCRRILLQRVFFAWAEYTDHRKKRADMKLVADLNYREVLLCRSYDFMRSAYIRRIERFNGVLSEFETCQKLRHERMYFRAFASAVQRCRCLRLNQVLQRLDNVLMKSLARKLYLIAQIGNVHLDMTDNSRTALLNTFRNMLFRQKQDGEGLFDCFKETVLFDNILLVLSLPLRSECIIFLHFLSGLKTRAIELMAEWGTDFDDIIVRICQLLTHADLAYLNSTYAYQLYIIRLRGFPSLCANDEAIKARHSSECEISPLAKYEEEYGALSLTMRSHRHQNQIGAIWQPESVTDGTYLNHLDSNASSRYWRVIPEWTVTLLQRLTLTKVFGIRAPNMQFTFSSIRCTAFDLMCYGMPLWRLINTMLIIKRYSSAFKAWRKHSAENIRKCEKLTEQRNAIEGLFNMSLRLTCFTRWLSVARISREQKTAELNQRCDTFVSFLSSLVCRSVSIVFMRLHLRCMMSTHTVRERWRYIRSLYKVVVVSCREVDACTEISAFRSYAVARKQFNNWRMHTQWRIRVTAQACAFYRDLYMRKGWEAIEHAALERFNRRQHLELTVKDGISRWRLHYALDAWHKTTRCQQAVLSLKPRIRLLLKGCFNHWNWYARNEARLAGCVEAIQRSYDTCRLKVVFDNMLRHFHRCTAIASLESRVHDTRTKRCINLIFSTWRQFSERRNSVAVVCDEIRKLHHAMIRERVFTIMHQVTELKRNDLYNLKRRSYRIMVISAACSKIAKMIDRYWDMREEEACREFFELQRIMRKTEVGCGEIVSEQRRLYAALVALSTLRETRVTVGLRALLENANYNIRIKLTQKKSTSGVLFRVFRCWRRCAVYRVRASLPGGPNCTPPSLQTSMNEEIEFSTTSDILVQDAMATYCLALTYFKHWRNMALVLPEVDTATVVDEFRTYRRVMDGLYLLKLHAFTTLWYRTCKARLQILGDSIEDRLKWLTFCRWKAVAQQNSVTQHN